MIPLMRRDAERTRLARGHARCNRRYADLAGPNVERILEAHATYPRVRGTRQILNRRDEPRLCSAPSPDLMEHPR